MSLSVCFDLWHTTDVVKYRPIMEVLNHEMGMGTSTIQTWQ